MPSEGSITHLIRRIKDGDREGSQALWEAYFGRLVALARDRLRNAPRAARDEEDVALSVFDSFFRRAEGGQFPQLQDRGDLWQLLFVLTVRKAINHAHHANRLSRGGGRVRSLGDLDDGSAEFPVAEPSPELAATMTEEFERLLHLLGDPTLRAVAHWKLEGYTNREIAQSLGCVEQTVERKLRAIRQVWSTEMTE